MKHFTQYLYEYYKGKKVRNVGFVKGELKEREAQISIQARGLTGTENESLLVYLFYNTEEKRKAVFQGEIRQKKPILSYRLDFSQDDIGTAKTMEEVEGVLLTGENEKRYAAVFRGEEIDVSDIILNPDEEGREEEIKVEMTEGREEEIKVEMTEGREEEIKEEVSEEGIKETKESEEQTSKICYNKIQRKDLTHLPRKEWRIANNSFLLHGYYNYHHLLWIEEDGNVYIGVPGVYHEKEFQAAKAFGFCEFRKFPDETEEQEDLTKDFGYFCRRIIKD